MFLSWQIQHRQSVDAMSSVSEQLNLDMTPVCTVKQGLPGKQSQVLRVPCRLTYMPLHFNFGKMACTH